MIAILGAGLAGLSASYHLGHERCLLLERNAYPFGHIRSEHRDGFTWDQGPHVSFTQHEYVKQLFEDSVGGLFEEIDVQVGNYFQGHWIAHPAQTSLYQVPEPIRTQCLVSFLETRVAMDALDSSSKPANYQEWLERSFGSVFANTFPSVYTRKYWTREPEAMTIEWIGNRVLNPDINDVRQGARRALERSLHYISRVRYPSQGGYQSFAELLRRSANIRYASEVISIDLKERSVWLATGERLHYDKLVNTLPLPIFVHACKGVPQVVVNAVQQLSCSQLLIVNLAVPHKAQRPEHWIYVYDEDKLSTRINFTEKLSPKNAPDGWTGIQVEVYFSRHRPMKGSPEDIAGRVEQELIEMGLIVPSLFEAGQQCCRHYSYSPWANVIFDHETAPALDVIWGWLETQGLRRELDDIHPLTSWDTKEPLNFEDTELAMAGRFAQWKYFWSDDCLLRGKYLSEL